MCDLVSYDLSGYVRIGRRQARLPHPRAVASVSPIHYISQSANFVLGLGVLLLRFGASRYAVMELSWLGLSCRWM